VSVPSEIASALEATGEVHLGRWSEAELEAIGFRDIMSGDPTDPQTSSSFSRLAPAERDRQVGIALRDLENRGLVAPYGPGRGHTEPVSGSPLELIRAVSADFVFFATAGILWMDTESPVLHGCCYGVRIPSTGRMAVLDEREEYSVSTYDYTLRTPDNYVRLVAQQAFFDDPTLPAVTEGAERPAGMCDLHFMWAKGHTRREAHWITARGRGNSVASLSQKRYYGLRRHTLTDVTEDEFRQHLTDIFAEICASDTAATPK